MSHPKCSRNYLGAAAAIISCLTMTGMALAEMSDSRISSLETSQSPVWSGPITRSNKLPGKIVLENTLKDGNFVPMRVTIPGDPAAAAPRLVPFGTNLLGASSFRVFGQEERVAAQDTADGLQVVCEAGSRPAGIVISIPSMHLPRQVTLSLRVEHTGSSGFELRVIHPSGSEKTLAALPLGSSSHVQFEGPEWSAEPLPIEFVLLCPDDGGDVSLASIELDAPNGTDRKTDNAIWLWTTKEAFDQNLVKNIKDDRIRTIYLQLSVAEGVVQDKTALSAMLIAMKSEGIDVVPVEGDPRMVLPDGRKHALQRLEAIAEFSRSLPEDLRFRTIQYDIEPYLLDEFGEDPEAIWAAWADTIESLASAWGNKIEIVVPFWMQASPNAAAALDKSASSIGGITVMAYRTAPDGVLAAAEPWLAWGSRTGTPVRVALENGPIDPELHQVFRRAETGTLAIPTGGSPDRAYLFTNPVDASPNVAVYDLSHSTTIFPERISFLGDKRRMIRAASGVVEPLSAWESFRGFAFHDFLSGKTLSKF